MNTKQIAVDTIRILEQGSYRSPGGRRVELSDAALYSDRMIYSTCCPVFRTDNGTLLEDYYLVDIITSPAPNAGVIRQQEP